MTAKVRAAIYILAAAIGAAFLIQGWATSEQVEAWLKVLDGCKFYPTAKTEWIDVKQGAAAVEQSALTGGDVKTLLDELQAKITK